MNQDFAVNRRLTVIGGGLAGCEAAWQAARCGIDVDLYEMRPHKSGPAHVTGNLAELVCSNSLRGAALENAVGLLKEELARLDSVIVTSAREAAVPAGGALAVDRERFARLVESRIENEPRITLHREEIREIPSDRPTIIACGPLPSEELLAGIDALVGRRLHYFDAASPIVAADSIDESRMYRKSRYEKGDGNDYINIPLTREHYAQLVHDLRTLPRHQPKEFELELQSLSAKTLPAENSLAKIKTPYFEGCLPIEEMADRGDEVLRFGPLKPVGLRHPITGITPYAVVQLRKENVEGTAFNLVGFQTRLTWPAQKEAFGKLPGLANAEWLRLGVMHRNTFIDSPRLLNPSLKLRTPKVNTSKSSVPKLLGPANIWFAGQITGAEGYVEAAACGLMTGIHAAREILGLLPLQFPRETALGAVVAHLQNTESHDFQPANVTWAYFPPLPEAEASQKLGKREKRTRMAERALAALEQLKKEISATSSRHIALT